MAAISSLALVLALVFFVFERLLPASPSFFVEAFFESLDVVLLALLREDELCPDAAVFCVPREAVLLPPLLTLSSLPSSMLAFQLVRLKATEATEPSDIFSFE
jgi:hypothetical protein